jgi:hypothetical protein
LAINKVDLEGGFSGTQIHAPKAENDLDITGFLGGAEKIAESSRR